MFEKAICFFLTQDYDSSWRCGMLDRSKVVSALQSKREQFTTYQSEQRRQSSQASDKLAKFGQLTAAAVRQALADRNIEWPGAEPTPELDQAQQLRLIEFGGWFGAGPLDLAICDCLLYGFGREPAKLGELVTCLRGLAALLALVCGKLLALRLQRIDDFATV
jgi:hypothetical protein